MTRYTKGSKLEREVIHEAISDGAILGMRGAGSKCYGSLKVDVILLDKDTLTLIQCKKSKQSYGKERESFFSFPLPETVSVTRKFIQR